MLDWFLPFPFHLPSMESLSVRRLPKLCQMMQTTLNLGVQTRHSIWSTHRIAFSTFFLMPLSLRRYTKTKKRRIKTNVTFSLLFLRRIFRFALRERKTFCSQSQKLSFCSNFSFTLFTQHEQQSFSLGPFFFFFFRFGMNYDHVCYILFNYEQTAVV